MDVPITGVVGVLGGTGQELERQLRGLESSPASAGASAPDAVEVRADLFASADEALGAVDTLRRRFPVLFTVRLSAHGGRHAGSEDERLRAYREALRRGAALVDAEVDSAAAERLASEGSPLVLSFHDFRGSLDPDGFRRLEEAAARLAPRVLKVVPTAARPEDALSPLRWLAAGAARKAGPGRVAFAMGEAGTPSRILSLAWGSAWTYASLGDAVAPGQPSVREMKAAYRASRLSRATPIIGVAGGARARSTFAFVLNRALAEREIDAVAIPLAAEGLLALRPVLEELPVRRLVVLPPFQEEALAVADDADPRARSAGCADSLSVLREGAAARLYASRTEPHEVSELIRALPACGRDEVEDEAVTERARVEVFRLGGGTVGLEELRAYVAESRGAG